MAQAASHVIAAVTEDTSSRQSSQMGNNDSAELADLERVDPGVVNILIFLISFFKLFSSLRPVLLYLPSQLVSQ